MSFGCIVVDDQYIDRKKGGELIEWLKGGSIGVTHYAGRIQNLAPWRRRKAREWGVTYVTRPGETPDPEDGTPPPPNPYPPEHHAIHP